MRDPGKEMYLAVQKSLINCSWIFNSAFRKESRLFESSEKVDSLLTVNFFQMKIPHYSSPWAAEQGRRKQYRVTPLEIDITHNQIAQIIHCNTYLRGSVSNWQ